MAGGSSLTGPPPGTPGPRAGERRGAWEGAAAPAWRVCWTVGADAKAWRGVGGMKVLSAASRADWLTARRVRLGDERGGESSAAKADARSRA